VVAVTEGLVIAASRLGKYKTVLQIVSVICLLIHYEYQLNIRSSYFLINFHEMGMGLLWLAMFVTVWSGIDYFRKFFKQVFYRIG